MELIEKLDIRFSSNKRRRFGLFLCGKCGNYVERNICDGVRQKTCGCNFHGKAREKIYTVWSCIIQRCKNKNNRQFKYYGGRGIRVHEEWVSAKSFIEWALNNGYSEDLEIDRIDNDGDYTPDNCRFVSRSANMRNSRATKLSWPQVNIIRGLYKSGELTQKRISEIFSIYDTAVQKIVANKTWVN